MNTVVSVSQINNYIKLLFSKDRVLTGVSIRGEVSNCKYHTSGHIYFTIKDNLSQLSCVMFSSRTGSLNFRLREGLSVIVTGSVNIYERDGKYQLYADSIEQEGIGFLYEQFNLLKEKLSHEGLFDEEHKKPIPAYCRTIGIITASQGAALQDIINISRRRNPSVKLILYPAKVQGENASQTLIAGIKKFDELKPDVIIIGRGGGSFEELNEFNNEALARAIYGCSVPVISAVGHETDFTICDFVSDLRAPTPSAAAELAVFDLKTFKARLNDYRYDLAERLYKKLTVLKNMNNQYQLRLNMLSPKTRLNNYRIMNDSISEKLKSLINDALLKSKHRLTLDIKRLEAESPLNHLKSGYAYITDNDGQNINSTNKLSVNQTVSILLTDGKADAVIASVEEGDFYGQ